MCRGWRDNGLVFCDESGRYRKPNVATQAFGRAVARVDVPTISLHGCRHTHASILLRNGVSVLVVQRLGHAKPSMTLDKYGMSSRPTTGAAASIWGQALAM